MKLLTLAALAASLALAACGSDPRTQVDQALATYTITVEKFNEAREPCVPTTEHLEYGPDHEACLISDAAYREINPVRLAADRCIKDADQALVVDPEGAGAKAYVACAVGAARAFAVKLIGVGL